MLRSLTCATAAMLVAASSSAAIYSGSFSGTPLTGSAPGAVFNYTIETNDDTGVLTGDDFVGARLNGGSVLPLFGFSFGGAIATPAQLSFDFTGIGVLIFFDGTDAICFIGAREVTSCAGEPLPAISGGQPFSPDGWYYAPREGVQVIGATDAVPAPAAAGLLGMGVLGVAALRRRAA